ncbi:restriction endonuclease subunit S [uncultured Bifidobacterium sp.]|uniref:restriction endonuclease subunit S n=1 Tax=uncultured Bifidobacterium sp. TaxID=165187 RepID=UPI0025828583|nr:restriction endonuclease subunit S [uncultured Bifidobacterium sp.]
MAKIDTSSWQEFAIGDLFKIVKGTRLTKACMAPGDIRFIGSSAMNNGCTAMVGNTDNMHPANTITVCYNGSVGETFYQDEPFLASDDVNVLYPKFDMTKEIALFIAPLIKVVSIRYNYVDKWKREDMVTDIIKLPVDTSGEPDWAYMDKYMSAVMKESEASLNNLGRADKQKRALNINEWQRFHLYDDGLFDIDMGTKLDRVKMTQANPDVNFVGRANTNNGITAQVDSIAGITPYEAGNMTLSLGGEYLGSCFVQPDKFYTSQNVVVLIPKWDMPFEVKQFIATMIFRESRMYYKAFIDELNRHIKTDFSFYLPVTSSGEPNWSYMGEHMQAVIENTQTDLSAMQAIG